MSNIATTVATVIRDETAKEWRQMMRDGNREQLTQAATNYSRVDDIIDALYDLMPRFPDGVDMPKNVYDVLYGLTLHIAPNPDRQWRGLDGTAGIVYRLRKLLNVSRFDRSTSPGYDGKATTIFSGYGKVGNHDMYITVHCDKQIPESCELVAYTETAEVTRYKTVCK